MRVTRLFAISAAIACGTVLPFLTGCGGSHNDNPSVTPSPSPSASPTSGVTLAYAGTYTSNVFFVRSTGNLKGPITFVITADGKFSATITASIVDDSGSVIDKGRLGVFNNGDTRTITGTIDSNGFFTGSITVAKVTDGVENLTDTLSGTMTLQGSNATSLRGPIALTDENVQLYSTNNTTVIPPAGTANFNLTYTRTN